MKWFGRFKHNSSDPEEPDATEQPDHLITLAGRQYLKHIPYLLPVDELEVQHLDFQHHMFRLLLRGNYAVPIKQPQQILDVGCGTARWAVEMAQEFPHTRVVGVDIVLPPTENPESYHLQPENYAFIQYNILEGLPFNNQSFDFVNQRLLNWGMPVDYWPTLAKELMRVTRPGGWVQLIESDAFYNGGPAIESLQAMTTTISRSRGIDLSICSKLEFFLRSAGFENIAVHKIDIPIGNMAGRVGTMMETNMISLFDGLRGAILVQGLVNERVYDNFMLQARQETEVAYGRCHWTCYLAGARRPA